MDHREVLPALEVKEKQGGGEAASEEDKGVCPVSI